MSAKFVRPNRVLSLRERVRINRELDHERKVLKGENPDIPRRMHQFIDPAVREDKRMVQSRIRKLERVLSNGSPDSLSKRERVAKERMVQEDREWLEKNMVPRTHINLGWRDIRDRRTTQKEYDKAVKGCVVEHSPEFNKRAERFKNNMREIAPDDPEASSIETIRPDTR
jgi:hypothetical protein